MKSPDRIPPIEDEFSPTNPSEGEVRRMAHGMAQRALEHKGVIAGVVTAGALIAAEEILRRYLGGAADEIDSIVNKEDTHE